MPDGQRRFLHQALGKGIIKWGMGWSVTEHWVEDFKDIGLFRSRRIRTEPHSSYVLGCEGFHMAWLDLTRTGLDVDD